jgi:sugar lactone lactonase YvrE
MTARRVLEISGEVLECPVWCVRERALYWVDIVGRTLYRMDGVSQTVRSWRLHEEIGSFALREAGGAVVALRSGLYTFDFETSALNEVARADYDTATTRFNDGKCDRQGRFWVGSMFEPRTQAAAAFYRLDPDRRVRRVIEGITLANGLAFSPDGRTIYFADTPTRTVFAARYDTRAGAVGERRAFARFAEGKGRPDGAAVDAEGHYWVATIDVGRLSRFSPDGRLVREVEVPTRWPTMMAFGGPELRTLYVTSLRHQRPADQLAAFPLSGSLFALEVDVPGLPEPRFAG